jgi:isoleucyl-tRNA synthetase
MEHVFTPLPAVPDHPTLERDVLALWERERTFDRLREANAGGPRFSFVDGPITANNPMGVHHAWGRTLKDVFQRYKALRGYDQRYQNGFDCQGLWVEVEVEKALGLNSKREIEEYGLAEFAARCRERVAEFAEVITEQSKRLGMWMDWDNDYYTFSDTNIEYIWGFLKAVHERGWLYQGHRATPWCPRCGTSISQHEVYSGEYRELDHPSIYARFPLTDAEGEALVVWTTTPWTLPANVAAAVRPDAEYGRTADGDWYAVATHPEKEYVETVPGSRLVGRPYRGPFDDLPAAGGVEHRVIPWDDVALDEGSGIVHIAPGAGSEDFELGRIHGLPVLVPIDESGTFYDNYGPSLARVSAADAERPVVGHLREQGLLVEAGRITHRYPTCWRCKTPLLFRVVDDWFISAEEIRQPMLDANATVEWTPAFYSKRMDDWLRNMGDWNISRKRYYGLPLPFYPCACGHLTVIGSREELERLALRGIDGLRELHRPWIDDVVIECQMCGEEVRRVPEVGDAWLDAGIVPLSTLGWNNEQGHISHGYATGAAEGLTTADLPDHSYWQQWFPADWVSEMREQIRLWFYSQSFMSVTLIGRAPYRRVLTYEKLLDETGREMHRSWGNAIAVDEALDRMGADVMRWLYSQQAPSQNMRFGYGPAYEAKRRLLTLWNSAAFLVTYANIDGWRPAWGTEPASEQALDRWLVSRTRRLVTDLESAYEHYWTPDVTAAFEAYVDDLSNWYIRRSRRRFWDGDAAGLETLWWALVQALRVVAPVMPFLADHVWQNLVTRACDGAPDSVFLAGWPEAAESDEGLLAEVAEVRRVVELGHQARGEAGIKLRQPLRRAYVRGADGARVYADEIGDELNVKTVLFDEGPVARVQVKPNLRLLGPKLGARLQEVRSALEAGEYEELEGGGVKAAGETLAADEVLRGERLSIEGYAIAESDSLTVALETALDDELVREGRAREWIRRVNELRKELGLELTDRIVLTLPESERDLVDYAERVKDDTLAVELRFDSHEPRIEPVR